MQFYDDLLHLYADVDIPPFYEDVGKIGKNISWYLADTGHNFVTSIKTNNNYILELDIKSAFPTICTNLFGVDSEFVQKMNQIDEKLGKNIYIATTLKESGHLHDLNNISKIAVIGILFDTKDEEEREAIQLFELKKDGCTFSCSSATYDRLKSLNEQDSAYTKFLTEHNFVLHLTEFNRYIRSHKTSLFLSDDLSELEIKGIYKHYPKELKSIAHSILKQEPIDTSYLLQIYSKMYWDILHQNNVTELLDKFYYCTNRKVLNSEGKFELITPSTNVDPRLYLRLFIYPSLMAVKMSELE